MRRSTVAIIIFALTFPLISCAQFFDAYGVRMGMGYTAQYWDYTYFPVLSDWKDYKAGFSVLIGCGKNINSTLSVRTELGYIQKGFRENLEFTSPAGEPIKIEDDRVIFHDFVFGSSIKASPFKSMVKPYMFLGLRLDYLMDYRSLMLDIDGETVELDYEVFDDFNKFTLGALVGIGIEFNSTVFLDLEFNPALTKNLDSSGVTVQDRYWGITLGLNLSAFVSKKEQ
jgi:hypothetical protein